MPLPDGTRLGPVSLTVADAERSMKFYRDLAGLHELSRDGSRVTLGAGSTPVLHLYEEPGAKPMPDRASGLYHTAILYPDRAALARTVKYIATSGYPFTGASDHLVSEAFYLTDPDGLGVELYRDRPRNEWRWHGDQIEMATHPIHFEDFIAAADRAFDGAPEGTRVGHVHLKVSAIADAETFYRDAIGFDVTAHFGDSATFMSGGRYHHHLGANIWHSRGLPAAGAGFAGLREFVIEVPGGKARTLTDPWGHGVRMTNSV